PPKLMGTVEADEVYVGGKPRFKGESKRGWGTDKTPVLGMVERYGDVRFHMMDRITAERVGEVRAENADLTCRLITDELSVYNKVGRQFDGGHEIVKHSGGEYVRPGTDVHSTTIDGESGRR
ncbi:MAG: transposase, partial [Candidatus Sulfotelmatobacter sp.]